jgi:outer membrane protein TolC
MVTQALLQGLCPAANLASLNQARLDKELSQSELKAIAQQVVFNVEKAYWELYLSLRAVQIREESVLLAERQVEETKQRIAVGKLPELEIAAAEAELADRQVALLDARSDLGRARLELTYLLNNSADGSWERFLKPQDEPVIPHDSIDPLDQHLELGKMYRPDLVQARIELKKGRIEVVRTRNGLLPKLDLFINLGGSSYAQSFSDATPDYNTPYYDVNAGLTLTLPVPCSRKSAEHRQSFLSVKERELLLDNMEQLLERDIRISYLEAEHARERIDATRVVRELQEANYSAELEKFRVGKSTNLQVALVQRNLTEALLEEAHTRVSYLTALTSLYLSEGTLLERSGIETFDSKD